jgi:hypothetical protein
MAYLSDAPWLGVRVPACLELNVSGPKPVRRNAIKA